MRRFHLTSLTAVTCSLVTAHASAQSFNIDFGSASNVPDASYAAAGLAGTWNAIETITPGSPASLVGLDGSAIEVTIDTYAAPTTMVLDDPGTTGDDNKLMDDFVPGLGDVVVSFNFANLRPGHYDVVTYGWVPTLPTQGSLIWVEPGAFNGQIVSGAWPGALTPGVTHAVHRVEVTDGHLTVAGAGSYWWTSGAFNGIQFVELTPQSADINEDGFISLLDLRTFMRYWREFNAGHGCDGFNPGTVCRADLDMDRDVDQHDLNILLEHIRRAMGKKAEEASGTALPEPTDADLSDEALRDN